MAQGSANRSWAPQAGYHIIANSQNLFDWETIEGIVKDPPDGESRAEWRIRVKRNQELYIQAADDHNTRMQKAVEEQTTKPDEPQAESPASLLPGDAESNSQDSALPLASEAMDHAPSTGLFGTLEETQPGVRPTAANIVSEATISSMKGGKSTKFDSQYPARTNTVRSLFCDLTRYTDL
jgi:hypothetical protein